MASNPNHQKFMLFNSFEFIELALLTFALYYLPPLHRFQISILIWSSLIFYAYSQPVLVLLLLLSVSVNIVSSYFVVYGNQQYMKTFAVSGVAANMFILCFFKYGPLFGRTFFNTTESIGQFLITIPLPIGISFFTFQGISLVVDVYTEKHFKNTEVVPPAFLTHAKRVLFFKAFFPQLISGPIVKAHDFMPQIGPKTMKTIQWTTCFEHLVTGYFLKMVVADNLKDFTFWIAYPYFQSQERWTLIGMLLGYSCQIFADFAGYSLIAIGLAALFGYHFKENFNFPYISTSFREFWTRWHISLSMFLREYLYIPLGGNRKGNIRTYFNLMLTMFLGGLWHGAAWSYAVWGCFHGLALAVERVLAGKARLGESRLLRVTMGLLVFGFVTIGWLLFKLPEFGQVIEYLKTVFNRNAIGDSNLIFYVMVYSFPVAAYHAIYLFKKSGSHQRVMNWDFLAYGAMIFMIITNSGSPGAFIYFQF
jgi:alginate O-acetyltransferase complex protein AlgI